MRGMKNVVILLVSCILVIGASAPIATSETATTSANVVLEYGPNIEAVSVTPNPVTMNTCPDTTPITVTATVYHPNGHDRMTGSKAGVFVSAITPEITGLSLPLELEQEETPTSQVRVNYTAHSNCPALSLRSFTR